MTVARAESLVRIINVGRFDQDDEDDSHTGLHDKPILVARNTHILLKLSKEQFFVAE